MKTKTTLLILSFIIFVLAGTLPAQNHILRGKVLDSTNNAAVINVNITVPGTGIAATTNTKGEFELKLKNNKTKIELTHVSYETKVINVDLDNAGSDSVLIIHLNRGKVSLGNIYVVSTRYAQKLRESPLPLEVVTNEEINRYKPLTVPDIISGKPGLSLQRDGIWATSISVRGMRGPDVITLVNGDRIETATDLDGALSIFDLDNIKQIEVIKNASSVLYGTGALGGIINIITNDGNYSNNFKVSGRINSGLNSVNNGTTNSAYVEVSGRNWTMSVNGNYRKAGNTSTPEGELSNSAYNDDYFSGTLGLYINENNKLKVSYQNFKGWDIGIPGGSGLFPSKAVVKYSFIKRDLFNAQYSVKNLIRPLKDLTFKFFNQNIYRFVDNTPNQSVVIPASNGNPEKIVSVDKISPSARHYVTGLQMQSNWLLGNNLVLAGIDAWQRNLDSRREKYLIHSEKDPGTGIVKQDFAEIIGEKPLPDASFRSIGIYAQDEIPFIQNKLKLTIGARADQVFVKNDSVSNPAYYYTIPAGMKSAPSSTLYWKGMDEKDYSWSGNINMLYNLSKDLELTFSYSHSFRSASLEERYKYIDLGSVIRLGNPELKPEKGNYFDAGIRLLGDEITAYGNVYINVLRDQIIETPGTFEGRNALLSVNAGRSRLYGFDGAAEFRISNRSSIKLTAAYVRGENLSANANLPEIPPLNGRISYKLKVPNLFSCEFMANIFSAQDKVAPGELTTPGYVYYNLYISSEPVEMISSKIRAYAGCENIFNKSYRNHLSSNRGFIVSEPGRNFFLKLSLIF